MATIWQAQLAPVTVIVGAFGSGKTEIAINAALAGALAGQPVTLVDLDTVTPAFRSRQAADRLEQSGVRLLAPQGVLADADLPSIPLDVHEALEARLRRVLVDVGGSPAGARAVSSLADLTGGSGAVTWVVVNPWRPETATPELIVDMVARLTHASRSGPAELVANLHVLDEGQYGAEALMREGLAAVAQASLSAALPCELVAVRRDLLDLAISALPDSVSVLPLDLYMRPPWEAQQCIPDLHGAIRRPDVAPAVSAALATAREASS